MKLQVDSRIGSKHLSPLLRQIFADRKDVTIVESALPAGDAAWLGEGPDGIVQCGMELCRIGDLVQKIKSGRLVEEQLPKILGRFDVAYLVIEGRTRCRLDGGFDVFAGAPGWKGWQAQEWRSSGLTHGTVNGVLHGLQAAAGLIVVKTWDENDTAVWLADTANWWQKPWEEHKSFSAWSGHNVFGGSFTTREVTPAEQFASIIPHIGQKKTRQLAEVFGSIRRMVNAAVADWIAVPGIGKKTAADVAAWLTAETKKEGSE